MTRRSDSSLAALLLVTRAVPSDVPPLGAKEFWKVLDAVGDPATLLGSDTARAETAVGEKLGARLPPLFDRATALAFELERLEQAGIATLSPFDEGYPPRFRARLGAAAPAVLHVVGPVELLDAGGLAVVGSRDVDAAAADIAKRAAGAAAADGRVVVSGGARGTDRLAMGAALAEGGRVVGVLADALTRTANDPEVRRAVADEQLCLVTPYAPGAPFSAGNAMGRNKLIYALADTTLVVSCEQRKGGTWSGAVEALKHRYGSVVVWTGEGAPAGNLALVREGADETTDVGVVTADVLPPRDEADQLRFGV